MADFHVQRGVSVITSTRNTATITEGSEYTLETDGGGSPYPGFIRITSSRYTGNGVRSGGGPQNLDDFTAHITNPGNLGTSITFERAGTANETSIYWEVVQYTGATGGENEFEVIDEGTVSFAASDTVQTVTPGSSYTSGDCVIFITSQGNDQTDRDPWCDSLFTSDFLTGPDRLEFTRQTSVGGATLSYSLIQFKGSAWSVQRNEFTSITTDTDYGSTSYWSPASSADSGKVTLASSVADISRAFLHVQFSNNQDPGGSNDCGDAVTLKDTSTLRVFRRLSGGNQTLVVYVVEHNPATGGAMEVDHVADYRSDLTGSEEQTYTITVADTYDTTGQQASVFAGGCSSDGGGSAHPRGAVGLAWASSTQVDATESDIGQERWLCFCSVLWPNAPAQLSTNVFSIVGLGTLDHDAPPVAAGSIEATLDGEGTPDATPTGRAELLSDLAGSSSLDATPLGRADLVVDLTGSGALDADPTARNPLAVDISTGTALDAEPSKKEEIDADLAGAGAVDANLAGQGGLESTILGDTSLDATPSAKGALEATLAGSSTLDADPCGRADLGATVASVGTIDADLGQTAGGLSANISGTSALDADPAARVPVSADLAGDGTVPNRVNGVGCAEADLAGQATTAGTIFGRGCMEANLAGAGTLDAELCGLIYGTADLAGAGVVDANAQAPQGISATISGAGSVAADAFMVACAEASLSGSGAQGGDLMGRGCVEAELEGEGFPDADPCGRADVLADLTGTAVLDAEAAGMNKQSATIAGGATVTGEACGIGCMVSVVTGHSTVLVESALACYATAAALVRRCWGSEFERGEYLPTIHDNVSSGDENMNGESLWARVAVTFDSDAFLAALGGGIPGGRLVRKEARMLVSLYAPVGIGDQSQLAMADKIVSAYRFKNVGAVHFRVPSVSPGQREDEWWRIDIACPFSLDVEA